jgi:cell division septation protein DedD
LTTVANDYDGLWHATSVIINLAPDFNVTQTYYRINNGPIENVSANGQPFISSEGSDNTLEYWSTWDIYGTGAMELPHVTLTGIQLQTTPPAGSMLINGGDTSTSSSNVTLTVSATDSLSGISQIRFSNDGTWDQATWEQYTNTVNWQLTSGDGAKTVYCQIQDNAGLITTLSSIILSNPQPMSSPSPLTTSNPSPTPIPPVTPSPSANVISSPSPIISPSPEPSAAPQAPELSIQIVFVLLALSTILFVVNYKRKPHIKQ